VKTLFWFPMTDFVRLEYLTLSEVARRVQADDPRQTPLTSLLVSSFAHFCDDEPWRIWYVPVDSNAEYQAIQDAFTEIGSDWAWDAQPPSPVLSFLWIIWLILDRVALATRTVKDRFSWTADSRMDSLCLHPRSGHLLLSWLLGKEFLQFWACISWRVG
jgi:hypothetical protein